MTEKRQIELEFFTEMKVKFVEDGKSTQHLFDLKDITPLLVFDPINGRLSPFQGNLPACSVWLLYSQEEKLTVLGGKKQADFQRLPGTWYSYKVEGWDLSQATEVRLGEKTIPVRREPSLVGNPSDLKVSQEQLTLYIGSPPKVRIPSEEGIPFMQNDWHVTLRDKDEETIFAEPLKILRDAIQSDNDENYLLLDLSDLLDLQPFGIFEIRLKEKQGPVFSLKFVVIPKLSLTGHKRVRVPDETGEMPEFRLEVALDSKFSLECADEEVCLAKKENGLYEVIAPARFEELELNLSLDSNSQISLDLPLPTLHWAFVESQSAIASPSANYKQLYQQWDAWYNSPSCYLKVWIAPVMQPISGRIQVHWDNNNYPQTLENHNNSKRELVFNLKGSAESVLHSCLTKIPFELRIYELPGHTESFSRNVLILKRSVREIINNLFIGYQRLINRQEHNKFLSILKKMKDSIVLSKEDRSEFEKISQKISPRLLSFLKRECPELFR